MAEYWDAYYARQVAPAWQTPFAEWCAARYPGPEDSLLELGCGNGRDSLFFLGKGFPLQAVDGSAKAVSILRAGAHGDVFHHLDFRDLGSFVPRHAFNRVYSRFVMHAIPEDVEDIVLAFCARALSPAGGIMLHEFRTTRDPLMREGEHLGGTARYTTHYRRFIDPGAFIGKILRLGFRILHAEEGTGLAVLGDNDPVVARVVAKWAD